MVATSAPRIQIEAEPEDVDISSARLGQLAGVMKNIRLFSEKVMPNLRDLWSDWEDRWWIHPAQSRRDANPSIALRI